MINMILTTTDTIPGKEINEILAYGTAVKIK
jgi:uncharacterized protein YbjQ (UPF0145 family)